LAHSAVAKTTAGCGIRYHRRSPQKASTCKLPIRVHPMVVIEGVLSTIAMSATMVIPVTATLVGMRI
jgi:hypothetical protein